MTAIILGGVHGAAVKIAISMPDNDFQELEILRKKEGLSRSKFILEAIKRFREEREKGELVRLYEEGYRRSPEDMDAVQGWEQAGLDTFSRNESGRQ